MKDQLFVDMVLKAWNLRVARATESIVGFGTEEFKLEVAPGKNTVGYLFGHLLAIHDILFSLLRLGERHYTDYDEPFLNTPDKSGQTFPPPEKLLADWNECHQRLDKAVASLSPEEWFSRHENISEEDFKKEPDRNRLSVLITRTYHLSYHLGQINLAKK